MADQPGRTQITFRPTQQDIENLAAVQHAIEAATEILMGVQPPEGISIKVNKHRAIRFSVSVAQELLLSRFVDDQMGLPILPIPELPPSKPILTGDVIRLALDETTADRLERQAKGLSEELGRKITRTQVLRFALGWGSSWVAHVGEKVAGKKGATSLFVNAMLLSSEIDGPTPNQILGTFYNSQIDADDG